MKEVIKNSEETFICANCASGEYQPILLEDTVDEIYEEVREFTIAEGEISVARVCLNFRVGIERASRIVNELESEGVVRPHAVSPIKYTDKDNDEEI